MHFVYWYKEYFLENVEKQRLLISLLCHVNYQNRVTEICARSTHFETKHPTITYFAFFAWLANRIKKKRKKPDANP